MRVACASAPSPWRHAEFAGCARQRDDADDAHSTGTSPHHLRCGARALSMRETPKGPRVMLRGVCLTRASGSSKRTLSSEPWTWREVLFWPRLYLMKPILLNRFMKKLTRDRVVPTMSASVC